MSFPITISFATPPEGTCPSTFTEAVTELNSLISGSSSADFLPYVLGAATPAVEDQDKAWIKLDAVGRPLGTYLFYSGSWRRQYTGQIGQLSFFQGDPALYFDGTGKGLTTADWDGWAICNGQNGTTNLSDRFLIGGHMDNSAGNTGYLGTNWRTTAYFGTPLTFGGAVSYTLTLGQIPRAATSALIVDRFDAGAARDAAGKVFGIEDGTGAYDYTLVTADAGNVSPDPVGIIPPFYAFAIVKFIGYS